MARFLFPFEIALLEILSESEVPTLSDADVQLLREFGPLLDQSNRFQDFSALMDSGIIQRVRELKSKLGESIYHPGVLATLAPYNAAFGDRFHTLFADATKEIKDFATRLEELGSVVLSEARDSRPVRFRGDRAKAAKLYEGADALTPEDIAETIHWIATLPPRVNVNTIELMPVTQAFGPLVVHHEDRSAEILERS